jgi:CheY-like chemotaxis protein
VELRAATASTRQIMGDPIQLRHTLIELGRLVGDELPSAGLLSIRVDQVHVRNAMRLSSQELPQGHYVVITFTGSRLEDGQGPQACYQLAQSSGYDAGQLARRISADHPGAIMEVSVPGQGCAAALYLPVHGGHMSLEEQPAPAATAERILIVDDDPAVLKVLERMLSRRGYQVVTAVGAAEALHVFSAERGWFDLVISDQTMPTTSGIQLGIQLNSMKPGTAMLLCSGFSLDLDDSLKAAAGIRGVLNKPIHSRELEISVRSILDSRATAAAAT